MSKHLYRRERLYKRWPKLRRSSSRQGHTTNADYIRRLSDEDLAFFICAMVFDSLESLHDDYSMTYDWLQEPEDS